MSTAVYANKIHKTINKTDILKGVSINVGKNSIYALLGPNGAGKTTTIRILCGLFSATSGEARIGDVDIIKHPNNIRGEIGLMTQDMTGYRELTVRDNIVFFARLVDRNLEETEEKLLSYLKELNLEKTLNQKMGELSGGERRAIGFIIAAIAGKDVLILDEPTTGLDIARAAILRRIIKRLVEEENKTIILSSHVTTDLEELATHVGILLDGKTVFEGTKDDLITTFSPGGTFEDAVISAFEQPIDSRRGEK